MGAENWLSDELVYNIGRIPEYVSMKSTDGNIIFSIRGVSNYF